MYFLIAFCPFLLVFFGFLLEVLLENYSFVIVWKNSFQRKKPNQIEMVGLNQLVGLV